MCEEHEYGSYYGHPWTMRDEANGVEYLPFVEQGVAGFICTWPNGRQTRVFLNPSGDSDKPNVFVYQTSGLKIDFDTPECFIEMERPCDTKTSDPVPESHS